LKGTVAISFPSRLVQTWRCHALSSSFVTLDFGVISECSPLSRQTSSGMSFLRPKTRSHTSRRTSYFFYKCIPVECYYMILGHSQGPTRLDERPFSSINVSLLNLIIWGITWLDAVTRDRRFVTAGLLHNFRFHLRRQTARGIYLFISARNGHIPAKETKRVWKGRSKVSLLLLYAINNKYW